MIELQSKLLIKSIGTNGIHQGQTGILVHLDPHADGDFYGVRFAEESTIYYFYQTDFEIVNVQKPEQRASADPGLRDLDLSELGIDKEQAARFDRIIVGQDTIAREDDAWLEAERRS
jgi:hypothetical protein